MATSPNDDMKLFADNLWEYFRPMLMERLEHNIGWFRAVVTRNLGNGKLEIQRPFDEPFTVKCVSSMSGAQVGTNVLVFTFGENLGTNAVVMGDADAHNIGGGGGGGTITAEPVGQGQYEEPLIQIANGGTGERTASEAFTALSGWTLDTDTNNTTDTWVPVLTEGNIVQHIVLEDYVLEQGTSGFWTYRKWKSGIAECWGSTTFTDSCNTAWGSLYETGSHYWTYPSGVFSAKPICQAFVYGTSQSAGMLEYITGGSSTRTPAFCVARPTSVGSQSWTCEMYSIGRWK